MPCALHGYSRRDVLRGACTAGLTAVASGICGPASANLFPKGAFASQITSLFEAAGGDQLGRIVAFELTGQTLPWEKKILDVTTGQQVTFFLSGRWHLVRDLDLWFEPGLVFFARTPGGSMYNPMDNAGTWVADADGMVEIARSAGEWANADGEIWTPIDTYTAADGHVEGVAIAWNSDAERGLAQMLEKGNPGGLIRHAYNRLIAPAVTPQNWHNHHSFGEAGVFQKCGAEMCCETHKNVSILRRDVDLELTDDLTLDWSWLVEELPSRLAENTVPTHDYLSIGVEFDDGQDITFFWSAELPPGEVFRCPLPGWNAIETHVVQRSGRAELGTWQQESRRIGQDYHTLIGGPATRAVRVWLMGVSVFQRQMGTCRYRNTSIGQAGSLSRIDLI